MDAMLFLACVVSAIFLCLCYKTLRRIELHQATLLRALVPYDPMQNLARDPKDPLATTNRTIFDQTMKEAIAQSEALEERLTSIQADMGYLRSFFWETQDNRTFEHVTKGERSDRWDRVFSAHGSDSFLLHRRERDYETGFDAALSKTPDRNK